MIIPLMKYEFWKSWKNSKLHLNVSVNLFEMVAGRDLYCWDEDEDPPVRQRTTHLIYLPSTSSCAAASWSSSSVRVQQALRSSASALRLLLRLSLPTDVFIFENPLIYLSILSFSLWKVVFWIIRLRAPFLYQFNRIHPLQSCNIFLICNRIKWVALNWTLKSHRDWIIK